ncbi:MAG: 4Fe-4S binding protein [Acidobacteria bacterium]|nr:4Fe-4S binding protein [Acidobacteriota bacterium]
MAKLTPVSFHDLLRRMRREVVLSQAIFDLPVRNWFFPAKELDFSARHFSGRASTPVGPAAGPHTQLAQNIVLSWLGGGRIIELKTVQVNDRLAIPRPCIHVPNVGYNVEWSQELTVAESIMEYAKAVFLIEVLKATRGFGAFNGASGFASGFDTVYDISVGYDLEGIRSEKVTGFLRAMLNATPHFEELRRQLTGDLREFREIELPPSISHCVTLSTFHGCPASQIEAIARYLLEELGLHVVIKFNPTLLGFEAVRELLIDRLGYHHLALCREAFEQDLQYDDALEMLRRLRAVAENTGLSVGAKFTNTLVVANNPEFFPTQTDPYMYLSGQPLHVIAMNLMQRFREDLGFEFPVSFSAGIERKNFPGAVACGMVPVTTCTDLLRQGGYGRLPRYMQALAEEMRRCGVSSREAYVLAARGRGAAAVAETLRSVKGGEQVLEREGPRLIALANERPDELPGALREVATAAGLDAEAIVLRATRVAGRLNGREIVPALAGDTRYHAQSNTKEPRRIARTLGLYDCINCDLCISACPNDAIFAYNASPVETPTELLRLRPGRFERAPGKGFARRKAHQLAVIEGLCNECSNCDVYCPEQGAPFQLKERVFLSLDDFRAVPTLDGFCRQENTLHARLGGAEFLFVPELERNRAAVRGAGMRLDLQWEPFEVREGRLTDSGEAELDTALLWRMRTVWESIFSSGKPNMVNPDPQAVRAGKLAGGGMPAGDSL